MKKILYLLLALSLVTVSCKAKKEAKEKAKQEAITAVEKVKEKEEITEEEAKLEPEDRVLGLSIISISKSVCFGSCPAYTAHIGKDGTLTYEGIRNVKNIGKYEGKIELKKVFETIEEVTNIGFFDLEGVYDNKNVTDLPSTTTYINNKGKSKKVMCRYDCDDRIKKINELIESLINNAEMTRVK